MAKGLTILVAGPAIAVVIAMVIAPHVTKTTPLAYHAKALASELKAPRPTGRDRKPMPSPSPVGLFSRPTRTVVHIDPSVLTGKRHTR